MGPVSAPLIPKILDISAAARRSASQWRSCAGFHGLNRNSLATETPLIWQEARKRPRVSRGLLEWHTIFETGLEAEDLTLVFPIQRDASMSDQPAGCQHRGLPTFEDRADDVRCQESQARDALVFAMGLR